MNLPNKPLSAPHGAPSNTAVGNPAGSPVALGVARLPLPALAVGLMLAAALVAALLAWGLGAWFKTAAWVAPLAAALGVAAAALPAALLLQRATRGGAASAGALQSPQGTTRELFMDLAGREWSRSRRYGSGAALLLVDVDRFARLAESRGGAATDAVLAELLRATAPTLRGADLLTRFSSSQMAVFLAHADPTGALDVAERIRERSEQMEVPFHEETAPRRLRVTVSVGVAQLRTAHLNLQALVDDAQDAVLAARQAGGNCVRAAPVDLSHLRQSGSWREDRAKPT
jgi:diguanylate cyclase (GGDEF)-like protein